MLYIIGVDHRVQVRNPAVEKTAEQEYFANLLKKAIDDIQPFFVGEESCAESLADCREISIVMEVTNGKVEHRFCDPNSAQKKEIGYRSGREIFPRIKKERLPIEEAFTKAFAIEKGRYFSMRERFWLDRLEGCRDHDGFFVCGYGHLDTFGALLDSEGIPYKIIEPHVGSTEEERRNGQRFDKYLAEHPEIKDFSG